MIVACSNGEIVATECLPEHEDAEKTKRATINLLRSLNILTSTLEPLPCL